MGLKGGKHIEKELDGIRCRIIEGAIPKEDAGVTFTIGVTDVTFNPVIKVYNRELMTLDNHRVSPDYWDQKTSGHEPNYWDLSKKK